MANIEGNDKGNQPSEQNQPQELKGLIPLDPSLIHPVKKGDDDQETGTPQLFDAGLSRQRMHLVEDAYALVIGIADYQYMGKLPQTVIKDAQDINNLLVDPSHCAYSPDNVQLLLDGQATQAAIRQALADLASRSNPDSSVFFYISSHGGRIESGPYTGEYLYPVNVVLDTDQSIAETAISDTEFSTALHAIPARKVVVVFDCCHAGGIAQLKGLNVPVLKAGLSEHYYEALKAGHGRVIIASSRDTEYSHVFPGAQNSLFTQHLLAGLRGGVLSDDGLIHIFDLFEYLQPLVTSDEPDQHPRFKSDLEENFPIGLYVGGKKGVVPRDQDGFRFEAYISYVDQEPDTTWVWEKLVPRLEEAGLHIAVSGDVEEPGVARVVGIERGITQSRRTVVVLSPAYLADHMSEFENVLGQTLGIEEGTYRLLPVKIASLQERQLPMRLAMLTTLDLTHPHRSEREFQRLVRALQGPLPRQ